MPDVLDSEPSLRAETPPKSPPQAAGESAEPWTSIIRPARGWARIDLAELWRYRDLVFLLVRRDFVAQYAQTILGPAWFVLQPVLTTVMFTLVFGRVARLPTDGIPPSLFYMAGVVAWSYFAACLSRTSTTFSSNAHLFGKVWFPRLVVPIAVVVSSLFAFAIQIGLLAVMIGIEYLRSGRFAPGPEILLLPLLVLQMGVLGLGCGAMISSLTTKYRDLANLVAFGVQLWMYATPVVYPASRIPERWGWLMYANPMAPVVEGFRKVVLGTGAVSSSETLTGVLFTLVILIGGLALFSRVEQSFMDTV